MIHSRPPDYGLLTGFSIVTVIMERIHGELLNILLAFPCRMYSMNHEGTGFLCCIWCVCVLHTLRIDSFYYVNR